MLNQDILNQLSVIEGLKWFIFSLYCSGKGSDPQRRGHGRDPGLYSLAQFHSIFISVPGAKQLFFNLNLNLKL